ncbi:hypothetical protein BKA93DRAFT_878760 [Sparassis latifolia]
MYSRTSTNAFSLRLKCDVPGQEPSLLETIVVYFAYSTMMLHDIRQILTVVKSPIHKPKRMRLIMVLHSQADAPAPDDGVNDRGSLCAKHRNLGNPLQHSKLLSKVVMDCNFSTGVPNISQCFKIFGNPFAMFIRHRDGIRVHHSPHECQIEQESSAKPKESTKPEHHELAREQDDHREVSWMSERAQRLRKCHRKEKRQ